MPAEEFHSLKDLFTKFQPSGGIPQARYQKLAETMVTELSMPTEYLMVACDELVDGTARSKLGVPPVIVYLAERTLTSLNRLDFGVRQQKKFLSGEESSQARPQRVIGVSVPMTTGDRGRAPKPVSQLDLLHKGLDRGHVMALEIGGPDEQQNIVPQWSQWQQSGVWRYHETQVRAFGELVLQAESGAKAQHAVTKPFSALVVVDISLGYQDTSSNTRWSTPSTVRWETTVFRPKTTGYEVLAIPELSRDFDAEMGNELALGAYKNYLKQCD